MELRNLRAFVEVVRRGGFTEAAKVVFTTQSTVSKSVRQLESELDVRLLDRSGPKPLLTPAGDIVYRRAVQILAARDDLVAELNDLRGLRRGLLRVGLPSVGSDILFAPVFAAYRERYPGIDIQLVEGGSRRLEDVLRAGEVEIAALLQPVSPEFECTPVWREPIVALCPQSHPFAGRTGVDLQELSDSPFILFDSAFTMHDILVRACSRSGFAPKIVAESSQIAFMLKLAAGGVGITFMPKLVAELRRQEGVAMIELADSSLCWDLTLAWRQGAFLSSAATAWLALATDRSRPSLRCASGPSRGEPW